ncbi:MAG: right-handed parallel beta-helix repeat-containing protein, partial [Euryarchaeota archaeon]|nr:right-handed parallel beta-helix repeat-containing protein [Euryarchaeota archaeon]
FRGQAKACRVRQKRVWFDGRKKRCSFPSAGLTLMLQTAQYSQLQLINHAFIGIQLQTSSYDVISGNRIENNGGQGIDLFLSSNHNSILNNSIINNAKEAILVGGISPKLSVVCFA